MCGYLALHMGTSYPFKIMSSQHQLKHFQFSCHSSAVPFCILDQEGSRSIKLPSINSGPRLNKVFQSCWSWDWHISQVWRARRSWLNSALQFWTLPNGRKRFSVWSPTIQRCKCSGDRDGKWSLTGTYQFWTCLDLLMKMIVETHAIVTPFGCYCRFFHKK